MTSPVTLLTAIMGISLTAAIAAGNANAEESILHDAIHDYSDDVSRSLQSSSSRGGYELQTVLDESYHDYDISDVAAFHSPEPVLERAEFAAFEEYSSGVPSVSFTD